MVKIESDPKLDFNSVLIKPKRSFLNSRSEVDLVRKKLHLGIIMKVEWNPNNCSKYGFCWNI